MSGSDSYDYSRRNDDYGDDDGSTNSPSRRRSDDNGRDRSPEGNRDPERERDGHGSSSAGDGNPSLHVTSMSFRSTEDSLRAAFGVYGAIDSITIIKDPLTKESRGYGFVNFVDAADADKAMEALSGQDVDGRVIRIDKARRKQAYDKTPGQYLGNPKMSVKYGRDGRRLPDNYRGRDDHWSGGRDRSRERTLPVRDYRDNRGYDSRDRYDRGRGYDDRGYDRGGYDRYASDARRGPAGGGYYDDRRAAPPPSDFRRSDNRGYAPR